MKHKIKRWFHGLVGGIIGGSATAGTSWLAMAGAKSAGIDVPALNWQALGVILLSGAVTSALAYLKQSPLPPVEDDTTIISKSTLPLLLIGALCISTPAFTACKTPSSVAAISYRTLASTQIVVDRAMKTYGRLCAQGKVSVSRQAQIDQAHAQYRIAFRIAVVSASTDYSNLVPDSVQVLANDLIILISQL